MDEPFPNRLSDYTEASLKRGIAKLSRGQEKFHFLVEILGATGAAILIENFGGQSIRIPKATALLKPRRNKNIYIDYLKQIERHGRGLRGRERIFRFLIRKYDLAQSTLEYIIQCERRIHSIMEMRKVKGTKALTRKLEEELKERARKGDL